MYERNILVTGGAGFIASSLAERLAADEKNFVVVVDNLQTGTLDHLPVPAPRNFLFIKADVNEWTDISSIFHAYRFDYVFHYAATVGVLRTLNNPVKVLSDIDGIKSVLMLAKNTGVKRVYFSSSSEVYGEPVEYPQNEHTTPLNSRLPYAIVKNVGEAYLKSFKREFGLDYTIFRFFNTYGPRQSRDFVVSKFLAAALKQDDITIYGDGSQRRTFCFIDDNIDATVTAFNSNLYVNDVANIGSDVEITILDLAKAIVKLARSKSRIVHLPPLEEGDMQGRRPDTTKMRALLGRAFLPLESGLRRIIEERAPASASGKQIANA
jgi:nucleoside-diphosphate-sugar epimerase